VDRLPAGPGVIFTTAYDQHAVKAFETNALDYLLKPIERERLDRALDRVAARRDDPARVDVRAALERLMRELRAPAFLDHLASRVGERVQLVVVDQVTHLVARQRATYAVTGTAEHMLDMTIAELEKKLDPARFLRIHRATLVNVAWIGELHADFGGRLIVRLKDPRRTELTVSRDRVRAVKERLGLA
jgi:two-component system, LytTR family, response regulator